MKTTWEHRTNKGKVIYERPKNNFRASDLLRIAKSFNDEDPYYFQDNHETFFTLFKNVGVDTIMGLVTEEQTKAFVETIFKFLISVDPDLVIFGTFK